MEVFEIGAPLDLKGKRFGRVLVLNEVEPHITVGGNKQRRWLCRCNCGNEFITTTQCLRSGDTKSCGCYKTECNKKILTTHGDYGSKLNKIWRAMRKRCNNPRSSDYKYYGGKSISVCDAWNTSYEEFKKWAVANGYREGLTIDRIDNAKGYNPENCRWVIFKEQCNNRTSNRRYTYNGETHNIREWADISGVKYTTLYMRLRSGKTIEEALFYNSNK